MTATDDRPATIPPMTTAARVALTRAGHPAGRLDGAWWPRSRDLVRELPALVEAMQSVGPIVRVTVNPTLWDSVPKHIPAGDRLIKVGWFTDEQDVHGIMLLSRRAQRWDLLVVPPDTAPDTAGLLMAAAGKSSDPRGADELAGTVHAPAGRPGAGDADDEPENDWESEGGHLRGVRDVPAGSGAVVG
ncbi:DUF5994 family protein [Yinghuangia aomiensis]|uniref:DUF5994 family protein n=1 Tax=Yinghuangia aomiensis TaxID=676205 RepID=A0ABP9I509_9ACTN